MTNLITLTTDFGLVDGFVGVMKGVILSINPAAQFVDITHDIPPQDIQQGAFLLANSLSYFPAAAIHVCVVDPGVGSTRRPLAVQIGESVLIGPDNGVLSLAARGLEARSGTQAQAYELKNRRYWLPRISNTFHGRDIFAPSAAHLSRGVGLEELGTPVGDWIRLVTPAPIQQGPGQLAGKVIHIDRYGNIVSDIDEATLKALGEGQVTVEIAGRRITGLVSTYSDVPAGEFAALIGSPWKLELARREGNAAESLGVKVGDEFVVRVHPARPHSP